MHSKSMQFRICCDRSFNSEIKGVHSKFLILCKTAFSPPRKFFLMGFPVLFVIHFRISEVNMNL